MLAIDFRLDGASENEMQEVPRSSAFLHGERVLASRRVFETLCDFSPRVEPYSIDEMFLDWFGMPGDLAALAIDVRAAVLGSTRIPTCVGIGPTKTIAKLANKLAKIDRAGSGVLDLSTAAARDVAYATAPIGEVWGLGRQSQKKLAGQGVTTAAGFVAMPADLVRDMLTVTGLRTHTTQTCPSIGAQAASAIRMSPAWIPRPRSS